jgi:MFS family permease
MRRVLALVSAVVLYNTIFAAALAPYLPELTREFDLSKTEAGVLSAAYPAGLLLGAIPGGLLAARIGVKPSVLLGVSLTVASSVAFALAPTVWLLEVGRFGQGLSVAASWTGALAWVVTEGPRKRRGELIGRVSRAGLIGILLGPVLGGAAALFGRAPAFGSVALLGALVVAWTWVTPGTARAAGTSLKALFAAVVERRVAGGLWLGTLTALLIGVLSVLAPLDLDRAGWGAIGVSGVFLVAAAAQACATPAVGRFADSHGRLIPVRAGLLGALVFSAAIPFVEERWLLAAVVIATALSYSVFWIPGLAVLSDGVDAAEIHQGLGFALMTLVWAAGQFAGAAGGGALADVSGDAMPFFVVASLCALTLVTAHARALRARPAVASGQPPRL